MTIPDIDLCSHYSSCEIAHIFAQKYVGTQNQPTFIFIIIIIIFVCTIIKTIKVLGFYSYMLCNLSRFFSHIKIDYYYYFGNYNTFW